MDGMLCGQEIDFHLIFIPYLTMVLSYANCDDLFINQCWGGCLPFYEEPRVATTPINPTKLRSK